MSFDLGRSIANLAPTLAAMLGGPLAGTAVSALESAFGLAPGAGVDGITKVMQTGAMTPDIIAAVRTADQRHAEAMGQQGIDVAKINADHDAALTVAAVDDRKSARDREVKTGDWTPRVLAAAFVIGYFTVQGYLLSHAVDTSMREIIMRSLGTIDLSIGLILAYYFGSSAGSQRKTELMAKTTPAAEPNAATGP